MSELEDLPSWAGRSADSSPEQEPVVDSEPVPQPANQDEPHRRRPWAVALLALFGVLALLAMGGIGYLLANSDDDDTTAATGDQTDAAADVEGEDGDSRLGSEELATDGEAVDADGAGGDSDTAADSGSTEGDAAGEDDAAADGEDTVTVEVDGDDAADSDGATDGEDGATDGEEPEFERQAVVRGGQVFLSGRVPNEEVGKAIEAKAAAVVGPDNVFNEYVIDPSVVIEEGDSGPVYIEEVVLFEFNSVAIASPFVELLDLGTLLMRQNPQATITVVTRTDSVGSEAVNLAVSRDRAESIRNYWLKNGVDDDQIILDPRGEELASDDDDEQTAALNRRAEFIITGLLD